MYLATVWLKDNIALVHVLPYNGLFCLRANFPEFYEWTQNLEKLLWNTVAKKFDCGSLILAKFGKRNIF